MDFKKVTLKEILEEELGTENAAHALEKASEGWALGLRGEELRKHCNAELQKAGLAIIPDTSFGCAIFL